jgi:ketosteroid isomerase-like protein
MNDQPPCKHEGRQKNMADTTISIVRKAYQAYVDSDRAAIEAVIGPDFHFTSPLDNRLDRKTYFDRCWKNNESITDFTFINLVGDGERVFVTYEGQSTTGKRFRNTEILTVRDGKIVEVEVYFGWSIPHTAPIGDFIAS